MIGDSPGRPREESVVNVPTQTADTSSTETVHQEFRGDNSKPSAKPQERPNSGPEEGGSTESAEGAGGDQRSDREAAEKAHDRLVKDLKEIHAQLNGLSQPWQEVASAGNLPPDRLEDVIDEVSLLEQTVGKLLKAGRDQSSSLALEAVATASVTEDDLAATQGAAQSVTTASGSVVSKTLAWVRKAFNQADPAKTLPTEDEAHRPVEAVAANSARQADSPEPSGGGDKQQKNRRFRNITPDRLQLCNGHGGKFVFAPLESRTLPEEWLVQELCDLELLEREDPQKEKSIEWLVGPAVWLGIIAFIVASAIAGHYPHHEAPVWIVVGTLYAALVAAAAVITWTGGVTVARQAAQFGMLLLVILVGIGLPFVVAWRFGQEKLWSDHSMATLGRLLQVVFVSLACIVPGLLFFLFDRQRLSTLRDRFEQQIFRLDPNVSTLYDVYARYGRQIEETYGQAKDSATMRLARQRRWPILVATIALAFGWILTLVPAGNLGTPTTPENIAQLFVPQRNAVAFGFLGAYFYAINLVLRRYARGDLRPKAYSAITVRILVVVILGWLVDATTPVAGEPVLIVAFLIGIVPETFLTFLREIYRGRVVPQLTHSLDEPLPLQHLEGIDLYDRARLLEEGVTNIQALAHHDLVDLLLETRIPTGRLVDWVDQAILYLHIVDPKVDPKEDAAIDPTCSRKQRLRQLGIRTATDLLTIYAKYEHDPALDQLRRAVTHDPKDDKGRNLKILIASLQDNEWLSFIQNWRCNVAIFERMIKITEEGGISSETRTVSSPNGTHSDKRAPLNLKASLTQRQNTINRLYLASDRSPVRKRRKQCSTKVRQPHRPASDPD
jgi:hypothetical protein